MLLVSHIIIAMAGIISSAVLFVSPTKIKFYLTYGLIGGTLVSGTILTLTRPAHITQTCVTGLAYLLVTSFGIAGAKLKLAHQKAEK
jgi:hypothetical protein